MESTLKKYNDWKDYKRAINFLKKLNTCESYIKNKVVNFNSILYKNQIQEIPSCFERLTPIMLLMITANDIENHPIKLNCSPTIAQIWLNSNSLTDIPNWIRHIKYLDHLVLNDNKIEKISFDILKDCKSLRALYLENNPITNEEIKKIRSEFPNLKIFHYS